MDGCIFHIDYLDLGIGLNMFFAYKSRGKGVYHTIYDCGKNVVGVRVDRGGERVQMIQIQM